MPPLPGSPMDTLLMYCILQLFCRIKSRWFRIQFDELSPNFKGKERCRKEHDLKAAMKNSKKSVHLVTSHISGSLKSSDDDFEEAEMIVEDACSGLTEDVDHRAQRQPNRHGDAILRTWGETTGVEIAKWAVAREMHSTTSGNPDQVNGCHYHMALKLNRRSRWSAV